MACFVSVFRGLRMAWCLFDLWSGMELWWMYTAFGATLVMQLALRKRLLYRYDCVHLVIASPPVSPDFPVAPYAEGHLSNKWTFHTQSVMTLCWFAKVHN